MSGVNGYPEYSGSGSRRFRTSKNRPAHGRGAGFRANHLRIALIAATASNNTATFTCSGGGLAIMNPKRVWEVALTMLGAVLLLIASAGRHPYGYYMVLRLVITVGAVYWAWRVYQVGLWAWSWVFAAVALLLNPFLPIRMQRSQWQPIDLSLGVLAFVWCGYWLIRKRGAA
jgi:Family of unknown function (DUF6804)